MTEQKIVLEFTEQQIRDLDAMVTEGFRVLRDDCTAEQREAAVAIVHRIDANRRALLAGEAAPDAKPDSETEWEWGCGSPLDGLGFITEAMAREYAKQTGVLRKCRKAGPWIEVTS